MDEVAVGLAGGELDEIKRGVDVEAHQLEPRALGENHAVGGAVDDAGRFEAGDEGGEFSLVGEIDDLMPEPRMDRPALMVTTMHGEDLRARQLLQLKRDVVAQCAGAAREQNAVSGEIDFTHGEYLMPESITLTLPSNLRRVSQRQRRG